MYQVLNNITAQEYDGLKVEKLFTQVEKEVLLISLEKNAQFPEHVSPRDALLVLLEGDIEFYIEQKVYRITKHQTFKFPASISHSVKANLNSKFLIIR